MKTRRLVIILAVMAMAMGAMAPASAQGATAESLENAGWTCGIAGPHEWNHCFSPARGKALPVMVFGDYDNDGYSEGDPLLGTELLLFGSVYGGQPCSADDGDGYHAVPGTPFVACHHYETPDHGH